MNQKKKKYLLPKAVAKIVHEDETTHWKHPGGKLLQIGSDKLSDSELLSILIATGVKGKSAERIADEIMERFGSFKGLADQPLEKLEALKGLGSVKTVRIAAAFEISRRIVKETKIINEQTANTKSIRRNRRQNRMDMCCACSSMDQRNH